MQGPSVKILNRYGKPVVHALLALPLLWLIYGWWSAFQGLESWLGFNPQEMSNRYSGDWALRILLLSLAVTPFTALTGSKKPIIFRRMLGLWAFFYVFVHLTSYVWLDMLFDWAELWQDVVKRLYITIGMTAFALLIPLAVTSTAWSVRRLGAKRWRRLHKSVYVIAILAVIHFIMMRKGWQIEPLVYLALLMLLYVLRIPAIKRPLERVSRARLSRAS